LRQLRPDGERLVAQAVELKDDRVRLAAVDAGVGLEVLDQELRSFKPQLPF
jgi:hypothetical protein